MVINMLSGFEMLKNVKNESFSGERSL